MPCTCLLCVSGSVTFLSHYSFAVASTYLQQIYPPTTFDLSSHQLSHISSHQLWSVLPSTASHPVPCYQIFETSSSGTLTFFILIYKLSKSKFPNLQNPNFKIFELQIFFFCWDLNFLQPKFTSSVCHALLRFCHTTASRWSVLAYSVCRALSRFCHTIVSQWRVLTYCV